MLKFLRRLQIKSIHNIKIDTIFTLQIGYTGLS